jgi:crossover junction endodeoxyribonuclease RusA
MTRAIYLPFPPAANNLFKNIRHGRARTPRYDAWLKEGAAEIARQRPAKLAGPYEMTVIAVRPDRRRRDLSNLTKALEDLLVKCGIVRDDSDAMDIHLHWDRCAPDKAAGVRVVVSPVAGVEV